MNRGSAERAVAESSLTMAETLTMLQLLRRAHNDTLEVPDWRTPTLPQLAFEVRVSLSTVRRLLKHLGLHTWVKVVPGRGRGHKSTYLLLPAGVAGDPCDCKTGGQHRKPAPGRHRKRGTADHLSQPLKGVTRETRFPELKGVTEHREKVSTLPGARRSDPVLHQGITKGEVEQGACVGGCGKPARRGCRTCWECARLELVSS